MWNRAGAYRCFTANSEIFDPCFSDGKRMLCPDDPFEDGVRLLTVKKVPPRSDLANQSDLPWGIELPSGNQCYLMDGHTGFRGDDRRNYKCDSGWIWGDSEVNDKTWLVQWTLHNNQTDPLQATRVVRVVY